MGLAVVTTGGTIASLRDPVSGAFRPAVSGADLVASLLALAAHGPVHLAEAAQVASWNMSPSVMLNVAVTLEALLDRPDVDGAIVTHGTDTVEETSFLLDLVVGSDKPVICAVAMRSGDQLGADGPRHLASAAVAATVPTLWGQGVMVCCDDELHAARWVRKVHSSRAAAFSSPNHGPLAAVTPAGVHRLVSVPPRVRLPRPSVLPEVAILPTYPGMQAEAAAAVLDQAGLAGLVVEGTGLGNVPGSITGQLQAAVARGLPVVCATRVLAGGTRPDYGGPGGGATLADLGVPSAAGLPAGKARLLLMLVLAADSDPGIASATFRKLAEMLS